MFKKGILLTIELSMIAFVALVGCGTTTGQQPVSSNGMPQNSNASRFHNGFGKGQQIASISNVLGVSTTTLMNDLKSGQSLLQIAQAKGISQQTLISDLEASYKKQLDQAVSSGHISSSQEQQMVSHYNQSLPNMVQRKGIMGGPGRGYPGTNNSSN